MRTVRKIFAGKFRNVSSCLNATFRMYAAGLSMVFILLLTGFSSRAGDGGVEDPPYFSKRFTGTVATVNTLPLASPQSSFLDYGSLPLQTTQVSKTIRNIITFRVNEEADKYIPADFTASVDVKIEYGHSASGTLYEVNRTFTVTYDKDALTKYKAREYFSFEGAEYVKVTITGKNTPAIGSFNLEDVLILENEMRVTRYFELPSSVPSPTSFGHTTPPGGSTPDHLTVNWQWATNTGNNASQLEWAWIEDELEDNYKVGGTLNMDLVFKNATRVDLPLSHVSYDVPLLYDGVGKLYYRVRAINVKESGTRSDGPWVMGTSYSYSFSGHNNDLNWQATTTFAEEGKRKSVVQYYDGSLRPRQTVTKDNTNNNVIASETFYDGQGRPAIQILPTPGIGSILKYQANLNMFNGQSTNQDPAELFDMELIATPSSLTPPLLATSGSSKYYSNSNPDAGTGFNKLIPDAEGYPYTVTRYTPDATGRVLMQSGVGSAHKMTSTHETMYYYGVPTQEELDGLFGTEVGNFTHYSKNMVKDANGQMSISYVDMHGRTIATALAGDSPAALDPLDKSNATHYPNQAGTYITQNLLDNGSNIIKDNSLESVNSILVPRLTTYNFTYTLSPQILQMAACEGQVPSTLCYDCLYDLEIAIVDESGNNSAPVMLRKYTNVNVSSLADDNCSTSQYPMSVVPGNDAVSGDISGSSISFSRQLPIGSYSIRKTLSLSESSLQHYKDLYMSKALCKSEQEIIDSIYTVLAANSNCANDGPETCQSCMDSLGTYEQYRDHYLESINIALIDATPELLREIRAAYINDSTTCSQLCGAEGTVAQTLEVIQQMMIDDMVPYGGQYAMEDESEHDPGGVHTMHSKYNIFATATTPLLNQPYYRNPTKNGTARDYYYDEVDGRDQTIHTPGSEYAKLDVISKADFTQVFKNTWAKSLLPYHPEYNRLLYAEANLKTSYDWLNTFSITNDWNEAKTAGFFDPTDVDPLFIMLPGLKPLVQADVDHYRNMQVYTDPSHGTTVVVSMMQLAYGGVKCKTINDPDTRDACFATAPTTVPPYSGSGLTDVDYNQLWAAFKALYMEARNRVLNDYIATHVPLPGTDETDLLAQGYKLWFPRDDQQVAQQTGAGTWWPTTTPTNTTPSLPPGTSMDPTVVYESRCEGYIARWKTQLLKCQALASHPSVNTILDEITSRMKTVCTYGSDESNLFGSSTVAPSTPPSVTDRSFEAIIKEVFMANGIISGTGIYDDKYCNPFVIESPKPYGKNTPMVYGGIALQIDSCNCQQYSKIKSQATSQGVNVSSLPAFNSYLLSNFGDTLTTGMFEALKKCNTSPACECKDLKHTIDLFYQHYPNGGMDTCIALPVDLEVSSRSGNTPGEYKASNSITFLPGFVSGTNDAFVAYIDSTGCDSVKNCRDLFVIFFNEHYHYNPPYTWEQIDSMYLATCGHSPAVCGNKDFSCDTLLKIECLYRATHPANPIPKPCQGSFRLFFNNYYNITPPLSTTEITALYAECDPDLWTHICESDSLTFCNPVSGPDTCTSNLPIILQNPEPLPEFLKCGYMPNTRCINCAGLSVLTGEYKTLFDSPISSAPVFGSGVLSDDELQWNINFARFVNYRTGFQFGWLDYAQAAASASPPCDLTQYEKNGNALQTVICRDRSLTDTLNIPVDTPCQRIRIMSIVAGQEIYRQRKEALLKAFEEAYKAKCLSGAQAIEGFTISDTTAEYHYTLYYYDQAGNLVKTVPPKGVRPDFSLTYTNQVKTDRATGIDNPRPHEFITQYRYNSLNQVTAQQTPDAGISKFWYDKLGRLVVSQNAQQALDDNYSYTLYDEFGRIKEVGQKPQDANSMSQAVSQDPAALNTWITTSGGTREQITMSTYDVADGYISPTVIDQKNLRNRVSNVQTFDSYTDVGTNSYKTGTFYTYDIHGNVDLLLQDYKGISTMVSSSAQYKKISYEYDLISGKVNQVNYQDGGADAYYHRYEYDAENRITAVETSRDKLYWERDAAYNYYQHGPLARTELGQLRVQGMDYAYTLHGWLKGINNSALDPALDLNLDGTSQSATAKDILGFTLHYYDQLEGSSGFQDYKQIGGSNMFARPGTGTGFDSKSLYNGNIVAMTVNNAGLLKLNSSTNNTMSLFYQYGYDQLNRIVKMQAYKGLDAATNSWTPVAMDDYKEQVSYDPNGNIETYNRKGAPTAGLPTEMDDMTYHYYSSTNRLSRVQDNGLIGSNYSVDIDDQGINNYTYDAIGNLVYDGNAGSPLTINWSVYGKIKKIAKASGGIDYMYDASGNRVSKVTGGVTTVYVRDASGNVMSVYQSGESMLQKECHLYGSNRLGMHTFTGTEETGATILEGDFGTAIITTFNRGEKIFELSNHLGNVLATVSDKKLQQQVWRKVVCGFVPPCVPTGEERETAPPGGVGGDWEGPFVAYRADILTATDYYPFGMMMPGRNYKADNSYRYGFNGKENDNEVKGEGNQQDYGMRIYDPRLGKFLSVDPLTDKYPMLTPYQFASNMPIVAVDIDGLEGKIQIYATTDNKSFVRIEHSSSIEEVRNSLKQGYGLPEGNIQIFPESSSLPWPWWSKTERFEGKDMDAFILVDFQTGRVDGVNSTINHSSKILYGNIGRLSERWESSGRGPGLVSTGNGDPGGVSYGVYQLASKTGTIQDFMINEGATWGEDFSNLTPGTAEFSSKWKEIAKAFPVEMRTAQHNYIYRTHYLVNKAKVEKALGINMDSYSEVLRDVLWSTAVQHGPQNSIFKNALKGKDVSSMSEAEIIEAIYNERGALNKNGKLKYFQRASASKEWIKGLLKRFKEEKEAALNRLNSN